MEATASSDNLQEINKLKEQLHWLEVEERQLNPSFYERLKRRVLRNPLVPLGCMGTVAVFCVGLRSLMKGNQKKSQLMMRWRVGLQLSTITVFIAGLCLEGYLQNKGKI